MAPTPSQPHAVAAAGGIAVGGLGTLVFAVLQQQWDVAIAVGTTVAPGALGYVLAHGGVKGLVLALWRGLPRTRAA